MMRLDSLGQVAHIADSLPFADEDARAAAARRQDSLTKPPGSLGKLEEIALFMAAWQGTERPEIGRAQALVFAGNHGVCAQGVNPFPQEVTAQMVANFQAGGAAINQLCRVNGADLSVIALDLDRPTADFTSGPAMTEAETLDAMNRGAAAVDPQADILTLGEMGIGNSTISAALCAALFGGEIADWVGRGTGSDDAGIRRKVDAITRGLERHQGCSPLEALAALGGREQAAICGAVLAGRAARLPVILDGFICTAAVAPLFAADPRLLDHCLIGHVSLEPGHRKLLSAMGRTAILDFDMRLGEGSGAALALGIVRSALACHNGMATFADAGISGA
ncbi:nicotinate-nucleotide--dimethylbenzimidazole phosphoribosyltransferase [Paracoccus sp. Z118]|uniref:nicotinate-nucleotide--dimethylbenzimidazole phosphoribosyltransferase n=1 Tax=Paracoccus sp. Z118 TaxID=2851017 RepID=UPI001C2C01C0|nr:nicotinate-nucleotide--dimethylbenzimidazole phosphoribosyltransferase [Paracoccus sp. Z118]MBV0892710.1 nicotinate-nucleotide--dimethylbenzimidazole phosphoribosyltransferase [Paracoccus sp. Z118]